MIRFLAISTVFLLFSCGSYPKKQGYVLQETTVNTIQNPYFSDTKIDYIYKAKISVFENTFGGILILKKIGEANHRIVFTTEMGNTLFDFSFIGDNFKVNRIIDDFNKKLLITILKNDFRILINENNQVLNTYSIDENPIFETELQNKKLYFFKTNGSLDKIVRASHKEKVIFQFSEINSGIAKNIEILHKNIDLNIHLKYMNNL